MATGVSQSVGFEVFGKVQGVFFRKHTQSTAQKLGLVGFVRNTQNNTVVGVVEGQEPKVKEMKQWLEKKGSPKSRIEKCVFVEEKTIERKSYSSFSILR